MRGVADAVVSSITEGGLKFYYSEAVPETDSSRAIVDAAREVHNVVSDIFARAAALPFRYPTVLADVNEIARLAAQRGPSFRGFLERVGDRVQMDVRLTIDDTKRDQGNKDALPAEERAAQTGRAYLEGRARCQAQLSVAAEKCRQAADSAEWRIVPGSEKIRCQALISRVEVISFFERMRALELPDGVKAAVSGPWPPAGFWEDEPR